jgi:predicted nuclease of predicted toxin-antitoxin system
MRKLKLLFDQNISQRVLARLPDAFADCQQVRTAGLADAADL